MFNYILLLFYSIPSVYNAAAYFSNLFEILMRITFINTITNRITKYVIHSRVERTDVSICKLINVYRQ